MKLNWLSATPSASRRMLCSQLYRVVHHRQRRLERRKFSLARLHAGEDLKALADELKERVDERKEMPRGLAMQAGAAMFFELPVAGEGAPPAAGRQVLPDNSVVLFVVDKVTPGEASAVPARDQAELVQELTELYGNQDAQALLQMRRREMHIQVYEDQL